MRGARVPRDEAAGQSKWIALNNTPVCNFLLPSWLKMNQMQMGDVPAPRWCDSGWLNGSAAAGEREAGGCSDQMWSFSGNNHPKSLGSDVSDYIIECVSLGVCAALSRHLYLISLLSFHFQLNSTSLIPKRGHSLRQRGGLKGDYRWALKRVAHLVWREPFGPHTLATLIRS